MSLTKEQAQRFSEEFAVVCCRTEKGTKISASDLEDPTLFDELEETGVISIPENTLKIGQVVGGRLKADVDGLTPLTADVIEPQQTEKTEKDSTEAAPVSLLNQDSQGIVRIKADRVTGLELEFPFNAGNQEAFQPFSSDAVSFASGPQSDEVVGKLEKRAFAVREVKIGDKTQVKENSLIIDEKIIKKALDSEELVRSLEVDIITPDHHQVYTDSIMDIIPIASKVEGEIGEGITNYLDGVVFMLTGTDENGVQVHEFGSCEGQLAEKISFGKPGAPDEDDIIIRVHAVLKENTGMERRGPYAAHRATDVIIQDIRNSMKSLSEKDAEKIENVDAIRRHGRPRVVLVKEIMGQGAMHDNVMMPTEPAGVYGGRQNVDLGNIPIVLSVNEVRDGGIHALACIGPATKEVTRHYFREPLVEGLEADEELDLVGVVFIGSPQVNDEKMYVAKRLGKLISTMDLDGAIVTTEGFGNNHIDFAENIKEIGQQGIPVVGVSFCAYQGQLVVGNKYMDALIEMNKDAEGFESEILAENTLTIPDADRAIQLLKNKMMGTPILPAKNKWDQKVIDQNQDLVDQSSLVKS